MPVLNDLLSSISIEIRMNRVLLALQNAELNFNSNDWLLQEY